MSGTREAAYAENRKPKIELIAEFSTYYGESSANRKHNVALAARKINGLVLYPEDEFSFNDTVGARTESNGFRTAFIISNGEFVEGTGGGVCQVSSTLYNCALLADATVTEVYAHSLPVSYVLPSFDAMVSSSNDFRFVNTLSAPITLKMTADGKYLKAQIFGVKQASIRRRSQTLEKIPFETEYIDDASLAAGEENIDTYGKCGLKSEGYLEYFRDGVLTKTVKIRKDCYKPQKQTVLRGTAPINDENNSGGEISPHTDSAPDVLQPQER